VYIAEQNNGTRIEVPGCSVHTSEASKIKQQLEQGIDPKQIRLGVTKISLGELFCRVNTDPLNLGKIEESVESKELVESKESKEPKKKTKSSTEWRWIEDFDMWMTAKGEITKISSLEDKELEDAVIQIKKANIKRCTKNFRWLVELEEIAAPIKHLYPEIELAVGREAAQVKLDEFYEVFLERGILP
jgi:hypothetical protein